MYANEHIVTLSNGDLRVSDHPVVVQMFNFTHVLEIMCRTGPDNWTDMPGPKRKVIIAV
jgi:hypothetical protein